MPVDQTQHELINNLSSATGGILWPALPGPAPAQLAAVLFQLEQSQWWSPQALREQQFRQLQPLVLHAWKTVPFYRQRLAEAGYVPGQRITEDFWSRLPLLTREEIQTSEKLLISTAPPASHGTVRSTKTSGSTGQPLQVHSTQLSGFLWMAYAIREHLWHGRDFSAKLAIIRAATGGSGLGKPPDGANHPSWGRPVSVLYPTGPSATLDISADVHTQALWLRKQNPDYLLTYPSNLRALAEYFLKEGSVPDQLKELRTISEIVDPQLRELCREAFQAEIVDIYSTNEIGYIASQCPESSNYHVQSENVLCELLNDAGEPCGPGETGRVVLSTLHNYAMPLLRYEIRDHAVAGAACACGRGLPVIKSILGRTRNMIALANGEKRWPRKDAWADFPAIAQFQIIQTDYSRIEARLVTRRPLTSAEEAGLAESFNQYHGVPFRFTFTYLDEIRGHENGKFEEFISLVQ